MEKKFEFLVSIGNPAPHLAAAIALIGTKEIVGKEDSPIIMGWAKELEIEKGYYSNDEVPWCGLAMGKVFKDAGLILLAPVKRLMLWALNWAKVGSRVKGIRKVGDLATFKRPTGGHVALIIAEDARNYFTLGGNQSNEFGITKIAKDRVYSVTRIEYKDKEGKVIEYNTPDLPRIDSKEAVSTNEA